MKRKTGYTIHRGTYKNERFVVIATMKTTNRKTGDMIQVWILLEDVHPVAAVQSGLDAETVCKGCPFASGNGCYVNVGQAPAAVWRAFHRGAYPELPARDFAKVFGGKKIRFGAYGNPSRIPLPIVRRLAKVSEGWTGYFHDWHLMTEGKAKAYNAFFMASTETVKSMVKAAKIGLRTFHVSPKCTASHVECLSDSHKLKCADCLLCQGTAKPAKNIWINPHGSGTKKATSVANG